jgi:hypothetical protein
MIDEPELNLHPENQIKMARLFVRLVNAGVKVWITTHSDYIIKELNNLLGLANNFPNKPAIMQELGYDESEILKPEDLRAYIAHDGTVTRVETDKFGMIDSSFDEAIVQINEAAHRIASAIENMED